MSMNSNSSSASYGRTSGYMCNLCFTNYQTTPVALLSCSHQNTTSTDHLFPMIRPFKQLTPTILASTFSGGDFEEDQDHFDDMDTSSSDSDGPMEYWIGFEGDRDEGDDDDDDDDSEIEMSEEEEEDDENRRNRLTPNLIGEWESVAELKAKEDAESMRRIDLELGLNTAPMASLDLELKLGF